MDTTLATTVDTSLDDVLDHVLASDGKPDASGDVRAATWRPGSRASGT